MHRERYAVLLDFLLQPSTLLQVCSMQDYIDHVYPQMCNYFHIGFRLNFRKSALLVPL